MKYGSDSPIKRHFNVYENMLVWSFTQSRMSLFFGSSLGFSWFLNKKNREYVPFIMTFDTLIQNLFLFAWLLIVPLKKLEKNMKNIKSHVSGEVLFKAVETSVTVVTLVCFYFPSQET